MLADLPIQAATDQHRERAPGRYEPGRDCVAGNGEIIGLTAIKGLTTGTAENLGAGRRIGAAEEGLHVRLKFRVLIELVARADDQVCDRRIDTSLVDCVLIGYCPCIERNAKPFAKVIDKLAAATVSIARWDDVPVGT